MEHRACVFHYWADTGQVKINKFLAGIFALFSCLRKYNRLATFLLISATWQFHRRSDDIFRPNNLTVDTTSIASPLITMGSKTAAGLVNEIRSSLHFDSFSWNLFWLDLVISSSTSDWIRLSFFLSTHSAIVVSSTYFHSSVLLVLISSIMRINSHGPSLVP